MRSIDRVILIVLALGIWALVLQPTMLAAHHEDEHSCSVNVSGSGNVDDDSVSVDGDSGTLDSTSVSIDLDADVSCYHY